MANTYYSGQGSVYTSERDPTTGAPLGFLAVGNVPELEISIEVTKYEHKESESGSRAVDLAIVQEKKGTFRMLVENVTLSNLAMGFWGAEDTVAAATDVEVEVTVPAALATTGAGLTIPIGASNVTAVTLHDTTAQGGTEYTLDDDFTLDAKYGTITFLVGTGALAGGETVFVTYTTAADTVSMEAFTEDSMERYVRFEGLNTIDGSDDVLVEMYKVQLDPIAGYQLINEEIAQLEITGSLLYDDKQTGTSKYFRQTIVA